jgi:hypothetical protein
MAEKGKVTSICALMDTDKILRKHLIKLLEGGDAHASFDDVVASLPGALQGKTPKGAQHSPWQLLEHLRIAQWDILEFAINPEHKSPKWPEGYWPKVAEPPDDKAWNKSVQAFRSDMKRFTNLLADDSTDLFANIPHGDGQNILRQALLAADHNAHHLGQLILVRRLLGAWK